MYQRHCLDIPDQSSVVPVSLISNESMEDECVVRSKKRNSNVVESDEEKSEPVKKRKSKVDFHKTDDVSVHSSSSKSPPQSPQRKTSKTDLNNNVTDNLSESWADEMSIELVKTLAESNALRVVKYNRVCSPLDCLY
jgi:hypothetical protein